MGPYSAVISGEDRLDLLVCNAGVATLKWQTTEDGLELMFGVNHIGELFLSFLKLRNNSLVYFSVRITQYCPYYLCQRGSVFGCICLSACVHGYSRTNTPVTLQAVRPAVRDLT